MANPDGRLQHWQAAQEQWLLEGAQDAQTQAHTEVSPSLAMHCVGHQWPAEALQGHEHLQQFAALAVGNAHVAEQGGQQLQGGQQVAAEANAGHTGSAQVAQAVEQENREQWLHVEAQDAHMQVHPELKPSQVTPKLA